MPQVRKGRPGAKTAIKNAVESSIQGKFVKVYFLDSASYDVVEARLEFLPEIELLLDTGYVCLALSGQNQIGDVAKNVFALVDLPFRRTPFFKSKR